MKKIFFYIFILSLLSCNKPKNQLNLEDTEIISIEKIEEPIQNDINEPLNEIETNDVSYNTEDNFIYQGENETLNKKDTSLDDLINELEQKQREKDGLDQKPPKNLNEYYQNKIKRANAIKKKNEEREYNRRNGIKNISDSKFDFSRERLGDIGDDNIEAYYRREEMAKGIPSANYNNRVRNEGNYDDNGNKYDKE